MNDGNERGGTTVATDFVGNLLVNTRIINNVDATLVRITQNKQKTENTLSVSELKELLVFIESIATAKSLTFDGTVPARETERVQQSFDRIRSSMRPAEQTVSAHALVPRSKDENLRFCQRAMQQSVTLMPEQLKHPEKAKVRPLAPSYDPSPFADALLRDLATPEDRAAYALELINENPFNGAKCVAGLLVCDAVDADADHASFFNLRSLCRDAVRGQTADQLRWTVPIMINAFRSNYLNVLGSEIGQAALFAAPEIEDLKSQQVLLLSKYATDMFIEPKLRPVIDGSAFAQQFQQRAQFPFLGLLLFLIADDGEPYSVFNHCIDERNELIAEFLARKTPQQRWIHDMDASEFEDHRRNLLDKTFSRLNKPLLRHGLLSRGIMRFHIPYIIDLMSGLSDAVNWVLDKLDMPSEIPGQPQPIDLEQAANYVFSRTMLPGKSLDYATFSHRIHRQLDDVLGDRDAGDLISRKVERLFGCALTP